MPGDKFFSDTVVNDPRYFQRLQENKELFSKVMNEYSLTAILESFSFYHISNAVTLIESLSQFAEWKNHNLSAENLLLMNLRHADRYGVILMRSPVLQQHDYIFHIYYLFFEHEFYMDMFAGMDLPPVVIKRFCTELDPFCIASLLLRYPEYGKYILLQPDHPFMTVLDTLNLARLANGSNDFKDILQKKNIDSFKKQREGQINFVDKLVHTLFMSKREFYQVDIINKSKIFPKKKGACAGFVLDAVRAHANHADDVQYSYAEKASRALLEKDETLFSRSYLHRVLYYQFKYNDPFYRNQRKAICGDEDINGFAKSILSVIIQQRKSYLIIDSGKHLMALIPKYQQGTLVKLLFLDPNGGEFNIKSDKEAKTLKTLATYLREYRKKNNEDKQSRYNAYTISEDFYQKPRALRKQYKVESVAVTRK